MVRIPTRVLLVDDEKDFVEMLSLRLQEAGEKVSAAYSGKECLDTLEKTNDRKYYYHDVFDSEGRYIARVGLPSWPTLGMIWKNDKLYTIIDANEKGFPVVKRYKVTWKIWPDPPHPEARNTWPWLPESEMTAEPEERLIEIDVMRQQYSLIFLLEDRIL